MSDKSEIAARITHHPIEAAIRRRTRHNAVTYHISFGYYFNNEEQGEGHEPLDSLSEQDLSILAKVVDLAQTEINKLSAADNAPKDTAHDVA